MRILIQNLQKRKNLATELFEKYNPEIMLVQEVNLTSESIQFNAKTVSRMGYGTAIRSRNQEVSHVMHVQAPFAEIGGFFYKKTTLASIGPIQFVSFHGYNGQPFKIKENLVAHIQTVLDKVKPSGPVLFAGDFNTWSQEHLDDVTEVMEAHGFQHTYYWPYDRRSVPLDHVFTRGLTLKKADNFVCASDHRGSILDIELSPAVAS